MDVSKIRIALAWVFGGPEGVVDYVLGVLNKFLERSDVAEKVSQGYALAKRVYGCMLTYSDWCPQKWRNEYDAAGQAVSAVVETFEDGKVEAYEVEKCKEQFKIAYAAWNEPDNKESDK